MKSHSELEPVGGRKTYRTPTTKIEPLTKQAAAYLTEKRGLRADVLAVFGVGCNPSGEIAIPFFDEKAVLSLVKFRAPKGGLLKRQSKDRSGKPETDARKTDCEAGGRGVLLGSNLCDPREGALVICFGDYDAISVAQSGVPNAVSLPFGDKGFDFIRDQWAFLEQFKEIVLFPDRDELTNPDAIERSRKKFDELVRRLGRYRCKTVLDEDYCGAKDANELLQKRGEDAVRAAVERAEFIPESGLVRVADYAERLFEPGVPTAVTEVDKASGGLSGGQLIIFAGDNEAGKTTNVLNIIAQFVARRIPTFIWSGEQKVSDIRYWFERIVAGPEFLETFVDAETGFERFFPNRDLVSVIRDWYRDYFFQYENFAADNEQFFAVMETAVRRHDCGLCVIDNLMAFTGGEGDSYFQAQGDFAQSCKMFAEKWNVVLILICHNKKKPDLTKFAIPTKDDVEGSKKITNWADAVFQCYRIRDGFRDGDLADTDAIFSLCKNRASGQLRDVKMQFHLRSNRLAQQSEAWKLYQPMGWETASQAEHLEAIARIAAGKFKALPEAEADPF